MLTIILRSAYLPGTLHAGFFYSVISAQNDYYYHNIGKSSCFDPDNIHPGVGVADLSIIIIVSFHEDKIYNIADVLKIFL